MSGIIVIKIAFSCTCQPNIKLVSPQSTRHLKTFIGCLLSKDNLTIAGIVNNNVSSMVARGVTFGRRSCVISCTNPPVMEAVTFFWNVTGFQYEAKKCKNDVVEYKTGSNVNYLQKLIDKCKLNSIFFCH